jgi:hypothetical protein
MLDGYLRPITCSISFDWGWAAGGSASPSRALQRLHSAQLPSRKVKPSSWPPGPVLACCPLAQISGDFVFFDADDDIDSAKKKKKGGKTAGGSKAATESSPGEGSKARRKPAAAKTKAPAQEKKGQQKKGRQKPPEDGSDSD